MDDVNFELGWKRALSDEAERLFVRHPFETALVELDAAGWKAALKAELESGDYTPGPVAIVPVPKAGNAVRPGARLSLRDRVVFAACLSAEFPKLREAVRWARDRVDFSHKLTTDDASPEWFVERFDGWRGFDNKVLGQIAPGTVTVFADIAGYYEHIDFRTLMSDLRSLGGDETTLKILATCLNKWAQVPGRGIPQGHSPSDLLGKVYLNLVDRSFDQEGRKYSRYVDDIRIVCDNRRDAKRAVMDLTERLRRRGLSLQTSKLLVLDHDEARYNIERVTEKLKLVREQFVDSALDPGEDTDFRYFGIERIDDIVRKNQDDESVEVLREAYRANFMEVTDTFDRSLFHFLLTRLGRAGDQFAVGDAVRRLNSNPDETSAIVKYLAAVGGLKVVAGDLVAFFKSKDSVYDYQKYELVTWLLAEQPSALTEQIVGVVRAIAFDRSEPEYLRSVAIALLGAVGSDADLERLQTNYADAGYMGQIDTIIALRRMERSRRNEFLGRVEADSDMHRRAVLFVRQAEAPTPRRSSPSAPAATRLGI